MSVYSIQNMYGRILSNKRKAPQSLSVKDSISVSHRSDGVITTASQSTQCIINTPTAHEYNKMNIMFIFLLLLLLYIFLCIICNSILYSHFFYSFLYSNLTEYDAIRRLG